MHPAFKNHKKDHYTFLKDYLKDEIIISNFIEKVIELFTNYETIILSNQDFRFINENMHTLNFLNDILKNDFEFGENKTTLSEEETIILQSICSTLNSVKKRGNPDLNNSSAFEIFLKNFDVT